MFQRFETVNQRRDAGINEWSSQAIFQHLPVFGCVRLFIHRFRDNTILCNLTNQRYCVRTLILVLYASQHVF